MFIPGPVCPILCWMGRAVNSLNADRWRLIIHAVVLMAGMVVVLASVAWLVAGPAGLLAAAVAAFMMLGFTPRLGPTALLRMHGAVPIPPAQLPRLYGMVQALARDAGLEHVPRLAWMPAPGVNAISVGDRDDAVISLSDGALRQLTPRQMQGILAHEVAHIATGDLRLMLLAEVLGRVTGTVAWVGLVLGGIAFILSGGGVPVWLLLVLAGAPALATLLGAALSRNREFSADRSAAALTGDPEGLAQALVISQEDEDRLVRRLMGGAQRFMLPGILRSHPAVEERVAHLRRLPVRRQGDPAAPGPPLPGRRPPESGRASFRARRP